MSDWKVTLRPCCRVKTFPPSLRGRERGERERGRGAVRQDAACPQDAHKYPCKLQFKRNQYEWQVANATIWGSNEGMLAVGGGAARAYIDNSKTGRVGAEVRVRGTCMCTHTHTHQGRSFDRCKVQLTWIISTVTDHISPCDTCSCSLHAGRLFRAQTIRGLYAVL